MLIEKIKEPLSNGKEIYKIFFKNDNDYSVTFYNFGGYIHSINIPYKNDINQNEDVLLGYNNFNEYKLDSSYLNCIIGRVCNRISNSNFFINDNKYTLFSNIKPHHLHGGKEGFNKKIWKIKNLDQSSAKVSCVLEYISPHLEEGYPGTLNCEATYSLNNNNEFEINFVAESDQDTIINLTNHNYWNFHGHQNHYKNITDHFVKIDSDLYCALDEDLIPTGKILKTKESKFDFSSGKFIDQKLLKRGGIDLCYCINETNNNLKRVGSIFSDITKMGVIYYTNQPGLQFYTGNMMKDYYKGKNLKIYGKQFGVCFEPQLFPDSINNRNFKNPILLKGKKYNSIIKMKLKNDF